MKTGIICSSFLLLLALSFPSGLLAEVIQEQGQSFNLDQPVLDLASSADGKRLFVLSKGGEVRIYGADGQLEGTLKVDPAMDRLTAPAQGDILYLSSQQKSAVQEIRLAYIMAIDTAGSPFLGTAEAPVELVVFSDFQCPYCSRVGPLFEQVLANNPGRLKVVFKNFPLGMHKAALPAAMAGLAAHKQGKFWRLHDLFFQHSRELNPQKIEELAAQSGLDMEQFRRDMASQEIRQAVSKDMQDGKAAGVRGTPALFVNGRLVQQRSIPGIQQLIDEALAAVGKQ